MFGIFSIIKHENWTVDTNSKVLGDLVHLQVDKTSGLVLDLREELENRGYNGIVVATALNHRMAAQIILTVLSTSKGNI